MANISNNMVNFSELVNKPQFYTTKPEKNNNKKKVMAASIAGSAIGILGATAGVYALAKHKNPALTLSKITYDEKDALLIGLGSVVGGLTGGLLSDKNKDNTKMKLREASQQFVGNMVFPFGILAGANRLLDKSNFKMPQINSASTIAKAANHVLKVLPKIAVTIGSLVAGMEIGNFVINKINNKIFKENIKHDVKAEDYLVHADDICITANMLLKDVESLSKITSKILPASFILSGTKTGIQQKN